MTTGRVVDAGCGKGRNAIYAARLGFEAVGLDYIEQAVSTSTARAEAAGVGDSCRFVVSPLDDTWPLQTDTFDVAIETWPTTFG